MELFKELYMNFLKFIAYLIPFFVAWLFISLFINGRKADKVEKEIRDNAIYVDADIIEVVPDAPANGGIVTIHLHYKFLTDNGSEVEKDDAFAVIKTMDLPKYQVGSKIKVIYSRKDPSKSMPEVKNAMIESFEKRGR